jgi:hypothetical protein
MAPTSPSEVVPDRRFFASTLLDAGPGAVFKAETLVRSLVILGRVPPDEIVVHRVPDLAETSIAPLRDLGCRMNLLSPSSGGAVGYTMLRQLDANRTLDAPRVDAYWMFAPGTVVTSTLPHRRSSAVAGKLVDRPPLPMDVLRDGFRTAGVSLPPTARSDSGDAACVVTQLDTRILYVPAAFADILAEMWRTSIPVVSAWPELDHEQDIEPTALALALAALGAPIEYLGANDSFPLAAPSLPASYDASRPILALRCSDRFDAMGFVSSYVHEVRLDAAVAAVNDVIAEPSPGASFALYKRETARLASLPARADDPDFAVAATHLNSKSSRRLRLVLHAGTPKTGTTALQQTLFRHVDVLAEQGIWYPPDDVDPVQKKHQFLVDILQTADSSRLARTLDDVLRSAPRNTHTIVMSTEGLFNIWWDYPPSSKAMLRQLMTIFDAEVWVCFREPLSFAVSQYAQLLRNPRIYAPAYGLAVDLEQMLENDWFVKRLDYVGFVFEVEELIGIGNVRLFRYGPDIVNRVFHALGATVPLVPPSIVHPSLHESGVALMKTVNQYELPAEQQFAAAALVLDLDQLIGARSSPFRAGEEAARRIRRLTERGWRIIEELMAQAEPPSRRRAEG